MNTQTVEIFYKSRQANREAYWDAPEYIDSLVNTHVRLHPQVVQNLRFLETDLARLSCAVAADSVIHSRSYILATIYGTMNHDEANPLSAYHVSGGLQDWMNDAGIGHTSMSRNDVVKIGNHYFRCDSAGWTEIFALDSGMDY